MNLRGYVNGWELPVSNCQFPENDATVRALWNQATVTSPLEHGGGENLRGSIMNSVTQLNLLKNPCVWVRLTHKEFYERESVKSTQMEVKQLYWT
jgi:hypothetical protein